MKAKFIEGTNQQYSIREDGVIIKNFKRQRITNTRTDIIKTNNVLKIRDKNTVDIVINNKVRRLSIHKLMHKYFNYAYCMFCNSKFKQNISPITCDNCRITNRKNSANKYARQWYKDNPDIALERSKQQVKNLTKAYIAGALGIKLKDLTEKLYLHHKNLILFKRQVAKKHNVSIHSLK